MRLLEKENACLITKKEGQTDQFTMADESLFIGMYRDTIYKNKLRVVPQEIMSNARDAHREVGKDDIPIEVILPSSLEPTLIIKDFGPGINSERSKIFSQYGASTKRNDDKGNGGFGIGCKCPWSYTESFIVETVCDEGGKKFHRTYSLYITNKMDPGNIKIISNKEVNDDVDTFTKVSIPIMDNDIDKVEKSVLTAAVYWKTPPNIINYSDADAFKPRIIRKGHDWQYVDSHSLFSITSKSVAVVDGICYNIDIGILSDGRSQYEEIEDGEEGDVEEVTYSLDKNHSDILKNNRIFLFFDVNEVEVAPDRENLNYTVRTIKAIRDKSEIAIKQLIDGVQSEVLKDDSDYLTILKTVGAVCSRLNAKLMWKDIDVIGAYKSFNNCRCIKVVIDEDDETDMSTRCKVPWDLLGKEDTAILHYTSISGAKVAAKRVSEYKEYFKYLNVKAFVFFVLDGYDGISPKYTKEIVTHKKISIPKNSIKTVNFGVGSIDGVYELLTDKKITNIDQIKKHSLFVSKKYNQYYLFSDHEEKAAYNIDFLLLDKLFPSHTIYSVSIVGERKLRKANYKIRYVDQYIDRAIKAAINSSKVSHLYYKDILNYSDYRINGLSNYYSEVINWLIENNRRRAYLAFKHYMRIEKQKKHINDGGICNRFVKLTKFMGYKIPMFNAELYQKIVNIINRDVPFTRIRCNDKNIMVNLMISYKE